MADCKKLLAEPLAIVFFILSFYQLTLVIWLCSSEQILISRMLLTFYLVMSLLMPSLLFIIFDCCMKCCCKNLRTTRCTTKLSNLNRRYVGWYLWVIFVPFYMFSLTVFNITYLIMKPSAFWDLDL